MDPFGDERRRSFQLMESYRNIEQTSTTRTPSPDGFAKKTYGRKGGKKMVRSSPWPSASAAGAGAVVKLSTDPQSVAARQRRHRISDRLKILKSLVPGGSKMDTVSMLEEAINYVKFLKAQIWLHQTALMLPPAPSYAASLTAVAGLTTTGDPAGVELPIPVGQDTEEQMISSVASLCRGVTGDGDQLQQANYSYDLSANYFPCGGFRGFEGEMPHRAYDSDNVNY